MASRLEQLYEEDFYAWTRDQAQALRRFAASRPNVALDFAHLIEEVEDLGTNQRDAVRSHLRTIIEHCLKLEHSRAIELRAGWQITIGAARTNLEDQLSPRLRRDLRTNLARLFGQARREAGRALRLFGEPDAADALPAECPYRLADLLRHDWYPASRHGLTA
jgi:Domain of unknown function DUF29